MSTGLFLVRRLRTWITRMGTGHWRISKWPSRWRSRITTTSLPTVSADTTANTAAQSSLIRCAGCGETEPRLSCQPAPPPTRRVPDRRVRFALHWKPGSTTAPQAGTGCPLLLLYQFDPFPDARGEPVLFHFHDQPVGDTSVGSSSDLQAKRWSGVG